MNEPSQCEELGIPRWTAREIVTAVLTAAVILGLVIHGWFGKSQDVREQNSSAMKDDFELRYFEIQSKLLVGLANEGSPAPSPSSTIADNAISTVISAPVPSTFGDASKAAYFARQAVLADVVDRTALVKERVDAVAKLGPPYDQLSRELSDALGTDKKTDISPELRKLLGWLADLTTTQRHERMVEASGLARTMTYGGAAVGFIAVVGVGTLLVLIFSRVTGRMQFRFVQGLLPRVIRLEIFLVYIAIMTGASFGIGYIVNLNLGLSQIAINLVVMAALPVFIIGWPLLQGYALRDVLTSLGLNHFSIRKLLSDILIAPLFYFATWVVLLPLLMMYALVLKLFEVDMAQGAHPVFSWLMQDKDPYMFIKVVLLAVVIAPILEEITFRGALYSWLRSRLNAPLAIFLTAFIFAIIHPQGPLGVLPLMGCAIAFGILREWRGSLYAPMIAHACFNGGTMLIFWLATRS